MAKDDKPISDDDLGLVDTSHLKDGDWAEINKWKQAYASGGQKALSKAMAESAEADPTRHMSVMAAFFPDEVKNAIRDEMAEQGMTDEDLRELIRKLESPAGTQ